VTRSTSLHANNAAATCLAKSLTKQNDEETTTTTTTAGVASLNSLNENSTLKLVPSATMMSNMGANINTGGGQTHNRFDLKKNLFKPFTKISQRFFSVKLQIFKGKDIPFFSSSTDESSKVLTILSYGCIYKSKKY
jgi:hypothetical protein